MIVFMPIKNNSKINKTIKRLLTTSYTKKKKWIIILEKLLNITIFAVLIYIVLILRMFIN